MIKFPKKSYSEHLSKRNVNIMITNLCNLSCGGCCQGCGLLPKKELWSIEPIELDEIINKLKPYRKTMGIFGGEPTVHPKFNEILEILYNHSDIHFYITTNGIIKMEDKNNVHYAITDKDELIQQGCKFEPCLVAPIDLLKVKNKEFYWNRVQKTRCPWTDSKTCASYIGKSGKFYICGPGGAIDESTGAKNGWDINKNPFDKTNEEIMAQGKEMCYKCGYCFTQKEREKFGIVQEIDGPSFVSISNLYRFKKTTKIKVVGDAKTI